MRSHLGAILVATLLALMVGALSLFVVDQRQNAIVFRLGEVVDVRKAPGLYFKIPLLDNVRYFDVRILTIDTAEPERFLTSEKKNVLVDLFVKWRITDVRQYYVSVQGNEGLAQTRLLQTINARGTTVVMATHDEALIAPFPYRRICLSRGSLV